MAGLEGLLRLSGVETVLAELEGAEHAGELEKLADPIAPERGMGSGGGAGVAKEIAPLRTESQKKKKPKNFYRKKTLEFDPRNRKAFDRYREEERERKLRKRRATLGRSRQAWRRC